MRRRAAIAALFVAALAACGGKEDGRALPETVEGTAPTSTTTAPKGGGGGGDAAAGKPIFDDKGCAVCHTFAPAGSSGTTGPNLDELAQHAETADRGSLEEYTRESLEDPNAYVVPGFTEGIMPPFDGSEKQLNDLVAFLTQS